MVEHKEYVEYLQGDNHQRLLYLSFFLLIGIFGTMLTLTEMQNEEGLIETESKSDLTPEQKKIINMKLSAIECFYNGHEYEVINNETVVCGEPLPELEKPCFGAGVNQKQCQQNKEIIKNQQKIIKLMEEQQKNSSSVVRLNSMDEKGNPIFNKKDLQMLVYKKTDDGEPILLGAVNPNEIENIYLEKPLFFELNLNSTSHYIDISSIKANPNVKEITFDDFNKDGKYSFIIEIDDISNLYEIQANFWRMN